MSFLKEFEVKIITKTRFLIVKEWMRKLPFVQIMSDIKKIKLRTKLYFSNATVTDSFS